MHGDVKMHNYARRRAHTTALVSILTADATQVSAPADALRPGVRFAYIKDLEGNRIELIQNVHRGGATLAQQATRPTEGDTATSLGTTQRVGIRHRLALAQ
jgi:hypothetical protein